MRWCLCCNYNQVDDMEPVSICDNCLDEAAEQDVRFDLDGHPYRSGSIGPWRVSSCCWSYAKGTDAGVVCRSCLEALSDFNDGPARLVTEDRFGRVAP